MDLAEPISIAAAIEAAASRLDPIDGLVNCAAIVAHADPLQTAWADWERISASISSAPMRPRAWLRAL
jgi:NAD(P)-dependent dehydrogenase (short-subunit alcohol dehydrogenase family)